MLRLKYILDLFRTQRAQCAETTHEIRTNSTQIYTRERTFNIHTYLLN